MHGKRYIRSGVFGWTPSSIEQSGIIVVDYAQHFDPLNPPGQSKLEWISNDSLYECGSVINPKVSVDCSFRVNSLAWSNHCTPSLPNGICVAGCDNGTVVFFDPNKLIKERSLGILSSRRDHQGHVLSVDISCDYKYAMSGGGTGQLLLWDLSSLEKPYSPGQPSFPDQVKCIRWNRSMDNMVASLSAHRCSLWDLRRHGAPVLDLGEVGGGCDWSELCWSPIEPTALLTASQSDTVPLLYKWDLRYATSPVRDHKIHHKGITSIDWSSSDPRFLLSSSHDHQILISNPETGDIYGSVGCEQGDYVKRVSWCKSKPDLMAIQYFQHPIQISSIQSFGGKEEEDTQAQETSHLSVNLNVIPSWVSAAPVGARFSLGCRMATHSRVWDSTTNQWTYHVNIQRVDPNPSVYSAAMELQNACDSNQLAGYCEDRVHSIEERDAQSVWMFLTAAASGSSRSEYLRLLGFASSDDSSSLKSPSSHNPTSPGIQSSAVYSSEVSSITNKMRNLTSSRDRSLSECSVDSEDFSSSTLPLVDYSQIDSTDWNTLNSLICGDDDQVIANLVATKDYTTAILLYRNNPSILNRIIEQYLQGPLSPSSRLLSCLATRRYAPMVNTQTPLPNDAWRYVIGSLCSRETDRSILHNSLIHLSEKWSRDVSSWHQSAVCSIIAHDTNAFLKSISNRSLVEQVSMTLTLSHCSRTKPSGKEWEHTVGNYCGLMVDKGCLDVGWRLLKDLDTHNEALLSLRYSLWEACGGRERTQTNAPVNPDETTKQLFSHSLRPRDHLSSIGRKQSVPYSAPNSYRAPSLPSQQYGGSTFGAAYSAPSIPSSSYPSNGYAAPPPPPPPPQSSYQQQGYYGGQPPPPPINHNPPPSTYGSAYGAPPMGPSSMAPPPMAPPPTGNYGYNAPQVSVPSPHPAPPIGGFMHVNQPLSTTYPSAMPSQMENIRSDSSCSPQSTAPPGWNDPPPLPSKKSPSRPQSVMQVAWKPLDVSPSTTGYGVPPPQTTMGTVPYSSSSYQSQQEPVLELKPVILSAEDQSIIDKYLQVIDAILGYTRSPAVVAKMNDLRDRINKELVPRLAYGKLSLDTRSVLWHAGDAAIRGDYKSATSQASDMVRCGVDFVEVSTFLPAIKSLFSQASKTFQHQ